MHLSIEASFYIEPSGKSPPAIPKDPNDPQIAGVREFMAKRASFEPDSFTSIRTAYERYLDYFDFCDMDIESGDALTRHRFSKLVLKEYEGKLTGAVERIGGGLARCFSGMRLIDEPSPMPQESRTAIGD
jgi:hypothetical protein